MNQKKVLMCLSMSLELQKVISLPLCSSLSVAYITIKLPGVYISKETTASHAYLDIFISSKNTNQHALCRKSPCMAHRPKGYTK
jgi:hypothetical protein